MTATILILVLLPIYLVYALVSSSNHLLRVNVGCAVGVIFTGITMLIIHNITDSQFITSISNWYGKSDNWLTQNIFTSLDLVWVSFYFLVFIIVLIITRLVLHYALLGNNPSNKEPHFIINRIVNILFFFILNLSVLVYLVANFAPVIGFEDGTLARLFSWVRHYL